ncbi:MAG: hypothetical protein ACUVQQ_14740, partial [Thermogutta sp.]
ASVFGTEGWGFESLRARLQGYRGGEGFGAAKRRVKTGDARRHGEWVAAAFSCTSPMMGTLLVARPEYLRVRSLGGAENSPRGEAFFPSALNPDNHAIRTITRLENPATEATENGGCCPAVWCRAK